jgi:diguanylate cyclase (GGDEF)-like protein
MSAPRLLGVSATDSTREAGAATRAIALLETQARLLRTEFLQFQTSIPQSKWFNGISTADLKKVNQRLLKAALCAAAIGETAMGILGVALEAPNSLLHRGPRSLDSRDVLEPRGDEGIDRSTGADLDSSAAINTADLLEANQQLVLAALQAETMAEAAAHNLTELARSSQRDVLTDTPNRALMLDRLENALLIARRREAHVAVLFVDLDHFKQINDTLGHAVGDDVLQRAARRLESAIRVSDAVSRHGGDEFLVLLTEVTRRPDAAAIAAKMLRALREISLPGTQTPALSASIGISVFPEDGHDARSLIDVADAAMYRAKQNGRNRFEFSSP